MKYFNEHLTSVNETYGQHFVHAARFSLTMFIGALACLVHAIFPFLFKKTGSSLIDMLHQDMVLNRHTLTPKSKQKLLPDSGNI